jgi:MoxR-like ATPase
LIARNYLFAIDCAANDRNARLLNPAKRTSRKQHANNMNVTPQFVSDGLRGARYITNERVETAVFLALALDKPLLIEGPAGSGKTEVAKVLAEMLGAELIRLQCYEGLDEARALYEWNYQKQLLRLQADEHQGLHWEDLSEHLFSREYLLERPLLRAISSPRKVVLLIDEIDKADEEFEAFLLELLSDFQVTVPELGTLRAREQPAVVLTSNRARELSEALRRRCLHLFIDFPGLEQERRIIQLKVPELDAQLAADAARFVNALRKLGLKKPPSIAETLDWARALVRLGVAQLDPPAIRSALGVLLKHEDDRAKVEAKAGALGARPR